MSLTPARRKLNSAYHASCAKAGLDEDDRHDLLEALTGHRSSKDCTDAQLRQMLDHLNGGKRPTSRRPASHPLAAKARALWISLHELGVVRDPGEAALNAWVKRMAGVDDLTWLPANRASVVIDGLKDWARREAGVDWSHHSDPRRCVVFAQWQILVVAGTAPSLDLGAHCLAIVRQASPAFCSAEELDRMIRDLGGRIREARAP